ncbi:MAG: DUF378 domain-containing protein [Actinomycetota bacterium]|nr:DUF378 domain-containing protein [Actinomycetota bacterium]
MFKRKKDLKGQVADATSEVRAAGNDVAKRIRSRKPNKVDTVTAAALLLGFANWISVSLFNFDLVQAVAKRKSVPGRAAYGFLGLSALYAAARGAKGAK